MIIARKTVNVLLALILLGPVSPIPFTFSSQKAYAADGDAAMPDILEQGRNSETTEQAPPGSEPSPADQRITPAQQELSADSEEKSESQPTLTEGIESQPTITENRESQPTVTPSKEQVQGPHIGFVDRVQADLSRSVQGTALWLDSFFQDERSLREENNSYVRFRYDQFQEEKSRTTFRPTFDLRLDLPQLKEKTHLVLSAEQAEAPATGTPSQISTNDAQISNPEIVSPQAGAPETRNATAALHYIFRSTAEENILVRGGTQFSHGKPVLFASPRYRSLVPWHPWNFRFTQEVVYRTDTLWQSETVLDLERQLPHHFFFRSGLQGAWQAGINGYFYNLGFSLSHPFGETHAVQYMWNNSYATRPNFALTQISLGVQYRHSFWRKWFFVEIVPQLRFPRDRNFQVTPGLLFRFELYFGSLAS